MNGHRRIWLFLTLLVGLLGGLLGQYFFTVKDDSKKETALERITRTGTIRCGYNDWAPFFTQNLKDGKPQGFMVDLMDEIAGHAGLQVEWKSRVDWSDIPAALQSGKVDIFCGALYASTVRAKGMLFGDEVGYQYLEPFVRAGDLRFTGTPEQAFNHPDVRIVGWEGTSTLDQARQHYPKATLIALPLNAPTSSGYLYVADGKADVFFSSMADAAGYLQNNPGKLKRLPAKYYLGRQAIALNAAPGEHDFLGLLNTALRELHNDGTFDRLYNKYNQSFPEFMMLE
jgi:polar amino acid transport system substrate-binding protein